MQFQVISFSFDKIFLFNAMWFDLLKFWFGLMLYWFDKILFLELSYTGNAVFFID